MSPASPDAVAEAFVTAVNARDVDAALELWTDDALFVPGAGSPVEGREAIREVLTALTRSETTMRIETSSTFAAGDTAVRVGRMRLAGGGGSDGAFELSCDYVTVYRREPDGWKIVVDAPAGFPND